MILAVRSMVIAYFYFLFLFGLNFKFSSILAHNCIVFLDDYFLNLCFAFLLFLKSALVVFLICYYFLKKVILIMLNFTLLHFCLSFHVFSLSINFYAWIPLISIPFLFSFLSQTESLIHLFSVSLISVLTFYKFWYVVILFWWI